MPFTATFITLSFVGLLNAGYLTYKHFQKKPLTCPIGHDCGAVVESKWGNIFGVRNEILGVLFYTSLLAGILILLFAPGFVPNLKLYLVIGAGLGLAFSVFLTGVQIFAIKNYCFYCLISAGLSLLLFLNSIALFSN